MNEVGRPKGSGRIVDVELVTMRRTKTQKECAAHFNVTVDAIQSAEARIKKKIDAAPIGMSGDNIDAMKQLKDVNESMVDLLKRCGKLILREESKMIAWDNAVKDLGENPTPLQLEQLDKIYNSNLKNVLSVQTNLINVSGETRKQIELQLKIAETLYSLQMMEEFQSEVVAAIKEVDPFTAQKLIAKLKELRTIRGLMKPI